MIGWAVGWLVGLSIVGRSVMISLKVREVKLPLILQSEHLLILQNNIKGNMIDLWILIEKKQDKKNITKITLLVQLPLRLL